MKKVLAVCVVVLVLVVGGVFLGMKYLPDSWKAFFSGPLGEKSVTTVTPVMTPQELIENFEISALDYHYRELVTMKVEVLKTVAKIKLPMGFGSSVKQCAVQFDGVAKMGINGKDVIIEEKEDGENRILIITVPKAYIISHEAPLNGKIETVFDVSQGTKEKISVEEHNAAIEQEIAKIRADIEKSELLKQAQESAGKQLESFLNAIPDIRDNYTLEFVLA